MFQAKLDGVTDVVMKYCQHLLESDDWTINHNFAQFSSIYRDVEQYVFLENTGDTGNHH